MDNNNQNRKRPSGQNIGVLALILVITLIAVTVMNNMVRKNQTQELGYEEFVEYLKEGEIDTAKISNNRIYFCNAKDFFHEAFPLHPVLYGKNPGC